MAPEQAQGGARLTAAKDVWPMGRMATLVLVWIGAGWGMSGCAGASAASHAPRSTRVAVASSPSDPPAHAVSQPSRAIRSWPEGREALSPPAAAASGASVANAWGGRVVEPDRAATQQAMRSIGPSVRACGSGVGGTARVFLVFSPQGRVSTVEVDPPHAGTSVGRCVEQAAREAQIPAFNSRPTWSVSFPFPLR